MWMKVPRAVEADGGGSAPAGDNRTGQTDKPVLEVSKAKTGTPATPPVSKKPAALPSNQALAVQAPIYANGDLLNRSDAMGEEQFGAIDKMISAINANSSNYNTLQLSVQIGSGNDPKNQYKFSQNGYNQLYSYIRSRLTSSVKIEAGSVGPASNENRVAPGSSVAISLH